MHYETNASFEFHTRRYYGLAANLANPDGITLYKGFLSIMYVERFAITVGSRFTNSTWKVPRCRIPYENVFVFEILFEQDSSGTPSTVSAAYPFDGAKIPEGRSD